MLGEFETPLRYENIDGARLCIVDGFVFHVGTHSSAECIKVPAGFMCDGQSYPRFLWFIDTPQGRGVKAGIVHDYLYWLNGRPVPETGIEYTRERADAIFRDALMVSGMPPFRAQIRYWILRLFGGFAWGSHMRRLKKEFEEISKMAE